MDLLTLKKKVFLHKNKISNFNLTNYSSYVNNEKVLLKYYDHENNWGDSVNPYLFEKITGKKAISSNVIYNFLNKDVVLGVGSIIVGDLSNYVIWGSGIMWENIRLLKKPKEVLALRGLKTLKKIQEVGGNRDVFGDPVLLFPDFYSDKDIPKKYKYGIVPHFKDKNKIGVQKIISLNDPEIKIIDIQNGIEEFVIDVLSCENILSSSLHGLILAEAYGIPTCRLIFSEEMRGGDFKFFDYYSGVGIKEMETVFIHDDISNLKTIFSKCSLKDLNFDKTKLKNSLIEYVNHDK